MKGGGGEGEEGQKHIGQQNKEGVNKRNEGNVTSAFLLRDEVEWISALQW